MNNPFHSPQQDNRPQGRFQDRRRDDQFHRGRDVEPDFNRGRENHHDRNESYRRDRSRDRYEPERRNPNEWRDQYDPRQAKPAFPGQYPPPMGGIPGNPPPPPPRSAPTGIGGLNPYQQQVMQPAPAPHQQFYAQQQQFVPQVGGAPPSSAYGHSSQYMSQRGQVMGGPPIQQQYTQHVVQPPYGAPQGGMGVPQHMRQPPVMGHQPAQSYVNPSPSSYNTPAPNRFSQPPPQGPGGWQNQGMQNPQAHHAPMDILGLADKAASAVQALQSQNQFQMPSRAPMGQPGGHAYPGPAAPPGQYQMSAPQGYPSTVPQQNYGQEQMQSQPQPTGTRRRTTASLAELPITVQYSVQVSYLSVG
jgi:hypothetical protein